MPSGSGNGALLRTVRREKRTSPWEDLESWCGERFAADDLGKRKRAGMRRPFA